MILDCDKCGAPVVENDEWDKLGEVVVCPTCGEKYTVEYEEDWDRLYFWLSPVEETKEKTDGIHE